MKTKSQNDTYLKAKSYPPECSRAGKLKVSSGFALLFAILASSVLLSIATAIWNIALREVILSSFGRESQTAFYVADSAIECALYWDFVGTNVFATSSDTVMYPPAGRRSDITCISGTDSQATPTVSSPDNHNATSTLLRISFGSGCATVLIGKSDPNGTTRSATNIESHGQNSCNASDPTVVERGLRTNY